jgi:ribosomal-protein-alanine N-acetyltransferase
MSLNLAVSPALRRPEPGAGASPPMPAALVQQALLPAHLDAINAIEVQCYSHPWSRGNFADSLAAGYLAQGLWHDEALIAYLVAQPGVDEMHLLNLSVVPRRQREGHATRLLGWLVRACRDQRMAQLWLEVRAGNQAARALYARQGFVEAGVRRRYYPAAVGREDAVVMRLDLQP